MVQYNQEFQNDYIDDKGYTEHIWREDSLINDGHDGSFPFNNLQCNKIRPTSKRLPLKNGYLIEADKKFSLSIEELLQFILQINHEFQTN